MPLERSLEQHLRQLLAGGDAARGGRLLDHAQRLIRRVERFMGMNLTPADIDREALELACYALALPSRQRKTPSRLVTLRQRAEQAAENLRQAAREHASAELIERAARILREASRPGAATPEAMLLADAANLDDFGAVGLLLQAMQLARADEGINQLLQSAGKQRQYGYWEARLNDGFHFEPVRKMARQRLANARAIIAMLGEEMDLES